MVVIKLRWKKWDNSKEMASCWYCGRPNNYVLYGIDKDYFEVFCCSLCKKKHGRVIKRDNTKSLINSDNTLIKQEENHIIQLTLGGSNG